MESQFPDLPAQVTGVRLAEVLGVLSKQADEEVDAAEVALAQPGQPGSYFGFDLNLVQACHASYAICIACYIQAGWSDAGRPRPERWCGRSGRRPQRHA